MRVLILVILYSLSALAAAQKPVVKLIYEQKVITKNAEQSKPINSLFTNSFQPILMTVVESRSDLEKMVFLDDEYLYTETRLTEQAGIYNKKFQKNDEVYFVNHLTGEHEKFIYGRMNLELLKLPNRLRKKGEGYNEHLQKRYEIFRDQNPEAQVEYQVVVEESRGPLKALYNSFFYDGRLILQRKIIDKKQGREVVFKLMAIDTLTLASDFIESKIRMTKDIDELNKHIGGDSLHYQVSLPNTYFKQVSDQAIVSLNRYKNNGRYLLIDFWGTWCKPCIASIPKLKEFYEKYQDKVDVLSMDYKDANIENVKNTIQELGMTWDQGIASVELTAYLNPQTHFPGILLFDDQMQLILRDRAKPALVKAAEILNTN